MSHTLRKVFIENSDNLHGGNSICCTVIANKEEKDDPRCPEFLRFRVKRKKALYYYYSSLEFPFSCMQAIYKDLFAQQMQFQFSFVPHTAAWNR